MKRLPNSCTFQAIEQKLAEIETALVHVQANADLRNKALRSMQQVEIIGWLYQFYISEKKDQVIGKAVKSEDIPAANQLFTPNWILKYLV